MGFRFFSKKKSNKINMKGEKKLYALRKNRIEKKNECVKKLSQERCAES